MDQRNEIRAAVAELAPELMAYSVDTTLPSQVNIITNQRADGSIVLHLLNYNYSRSNDSFLMVPESEITIDIPSMSTPVISQVVQLDGSVQTLPTNINNTSMTIHIPEFESYAVVNVGTDILLTSTLDNN